MANRMALINILTFIIFSSSCLNVGSTAIRNLKESCSTEYNCVDQHTLRICAPSSFGGFYEIERISCAGDCSWCDPQSVSCVPDEPPEYMPKSTPVPVTPVPNMFTCMGNGFFPDLSDCSRYYNCVGEILQPFLQECSGETPYYAFEFQSCHSSQDYCANLATGCDDSNPNWFRGKQQLGPLGKYFYYCYGSVPTAVNKCGGAYKFNITSEECEPSCPHAGLFPSIEDSALYYRCSPLTGDLYETQFSMSPMISCPEGQQFSEQDFQCETTS